MRDSHRESPDIEPGAPVYATDGVIGIVERIVEDSDRAGAWALKVRSSRDGAVIEIPADAVALSATTPREVRLSVSAADATLTSTAKDRASTNRVVVPEHEEVLIPHVRDVEFGSIVVTKRVETVPIETTIDLEQDEVTVERVPIEREIETAPAPRYEGDVLIVPVVEEVLVTEKRLMLREEVRISRRRIAEPTVVRDTVRREVVELERRGDVAMAPDDEATPPV